jgi:exopolyphosphatase / guanosine-5'-triphosphate,3'-diphosphate pyrophosphatase
MSEPVHIAAIDAGSNAVRLSVARAYSALDIEPLYSERYSLRLGESVFLRHRFSEDVFKKAIKAFRHFKEVMDEYGVTRYRAVATSASREARNRKKFLREIKRKCGVALEVISSAEESRLGREAAVAALGPESPPRCIIDLGGGSLEINILRDHSVEQCRRHTPRASGTSASLRARPPGIEIAFAAQPWRYHCRCAWRQR